VLCVSHAYMVYRLERRGAYVPGSVCLVCFEEPDDKDVKCGSCASEYTFCDTCISSSSSVSGRLKCLYCRERCIYFSEEDLLIEEQREREKQERRRRNQQRQRAPNTFRSYNCGYCTMYNRNNARRQGFVPVVSRGHSVRSCALRVNNGIYLILY